MTGARREEIFGLSWRKVDLDVNLVHLPAERSKARTERNIPLSPPALALLHSLPRFDRSDVVFSFTGKKRIDNVGRAKPRLDKAIAAAREQPLPTWRLLTTFAARSPQACTAWRPLEVIETVLGHVSSSRVGNDQRYRFEAEAKVALVAWGEHVMTAIEPSKKASVVPFPRNR